VGNRDLQEETANLKDENKEVNNRQTPPVSKERNHATKRVVERVNVIKKV
jgi:hypothetical protein